jgi:radical SAM enzyme (TIGR01210 family)
VAQVRNPFLSTVCARLRHRRPPFGEGANVTVGHEVVDGAPFIRLWFRTTGCTYDRQGLCTMCDYGEGDRLPETIEDDFRAAVEAAGITAEATVLVSPSGSMFDPREVPDHVRTELLRVVAESPARTVLCETRPETVTRERMEEFASILADKAGVVELGLESADPWALRWLVNKKLDLATFGAAVRICHDAGLRVLANVSLGTAMLSPSAAIRDAERAVRWAIEAGTDACVVFPLQVREWTLLAWLWRHGRYAPVSLWSLIEVLRTVGREFPGRVSTAWYRDYNATDNAASVSMPVLASPTTCPACLQVVLAALDDYRNTSDPAVLDGVVSLGCSCRTEWLRTLDDPLVDVAKTYEAIGRDVLGDAWWSAHGGAVLEQLQDGLTVG